MDEIQSFPQLLAKLWWFAEEMPHLAVIATGSLLEFAHEEPSFSVPVGRINFMHLEPLSFEEYLMAQEAISLLDYLRAFNLKQTILHSISDQICWAQHDAKACAILILFTGIGFLFPLGDFLSFSDF